MRDQITTILTNSAITLVSALGSLLILEAAKYVKSLRAVKDNELAKNIVDRFADAAETAVASVRQTMPNASNADKKAAAVLTTKAIVGPAGVEALKQVVGATNIEVVTGHAVESAVHGTKAPTNGTTTATAVATTTTTETK